MLLAGEDVNNFGSGLRGRDESVQMGHVRGGSGSYMDSSYPSPTTWNSGMSDLPLSMEALYHLSRAPPTKATQYMSQYLMRARGSETKECGLPRGRERLSSILY
jgi:hypothetical protein